MGASHYWCLVLSLEVRPLSDDLRPPKYRVNMPDDSVIRVKCPLCDADVVAQRGPAYHRITCDFCLEEFTAPTPKSASQTKAPQANRAGEDRTVELPTTFDDPLPLDAASADPMGFDLSDGSDSDLTFADDLTGTTPASKSKAEGDSQAPGSDESDEQWLRVDEDLTTPSEDHPAKKVVLTEDYEFSGPCPLCQTRFVATDDQIGTTLKCPDCYTEFEIREPLPGARQPRRQSGNNWDDDDDLRLSEPDDLTEMQLSTDDVLGSPLQSVRPVPNATTWIRDETGIDGQAAVASAILQKAESEAEEEEAKEAALPDSPLTSGVLSCFLDPSLLIRWLLFSIAIQVELSAFNGALKWGAIGDPMSQFVCLALSCFSFCFGVILLLVASVSLLAITQDTASGRDQIENWPGANFMDWVFDAFYVLAAVFACFLLGGLVGQIFLPFGMAIYVWGMLAAVAISSGVVFPIYFLGVLETGSPINPFSAPVLRSLTAARATWIRFALMSLGLGFIAVLGGLLRIFDSTILNFLSAAIVSWALILYFRMLGRLTWSCQETVANDQRLREATS